VQGNLSAEESEEGVPATCVDQPIPTRGENYTFLPSSIKKFCGSSLATTDAIKRKITADLVTKASVDRLVRFDCPATILTNCKF